MKLLNNDDIASKALFGNYDVRLCISPLVGEGCDLLPDEFTCVKNAVEKRQKEFATSRLIARHLLQQYDIKDYCLLNDMDRVPVWPEKVLGTIAHSDEYCIVAATHQNHSSLKGIGVDVEPQQDLEQDLWPAILRENEAEIVDHLTKNEQASVVNKYFCAKEAAYKCIFPITRKIIDFQSVEIDFLPEFEVFSVVFHDQETMGKLSNYMVAGRIYQSYGHVFSAAILVE